MNDGAVCANVPDAALPKTAESILRLVSRTDEEWAALFAPYFKDGCSI